MPNRSSAPTPIIVADRLAGVLVTEDRRFRFVAVDRRFRVLDGSRLARPDAARQSAVRLADATTEQEIGDQEGCGDRLGGCGRRVDWAGATTWGRLPSP